MVASHQRSLSKTFSQTFSIYEEPMKRNPLMKKFLQMMKEILFGIFYSKSKRKLKNMKEKIWFDKF